ncbi:RDD family protein [Streptomyces sp. NPDC048639]|uniref:RDD family protein n=1 Tax=Streptomyces sp. NPDC048639 TaxID=3365581 RepID=UPI003722934D
MCGRLLLPTAQHGKSRYDGTRSMSAPTSGSAGGSPAPGFYPDPSIPGYIRYWNGAAWVPGTSRPAPADGEAMPGPPGGAPSASPEPGPEERGPVFVDEAGGGGGPQAGPGSALPELRPRGAMDAQSSEGIDWSDPQRLHGSRPEPASAWGADASRQTGMSDRGQVSWGANPSEGDPRTGDPRTGGADPCTGAGDPRTGGGAASGEGGTPGSVDLGGGRSSVERDRESDRGPAAEGDRPRTDGRLALRTDAGADSASAPPATGPAAGGEAEADGTMAIRAVRPGADRGTPSVPPARDGGSAPGQSGRTDRSDPVQAPQDGTMTIRATPGPSAGSQASDGRTDGTMAIRRARRTGTPGGGIPAQPGPAAAQSSHGPAQAQVPGPNAQAPAPNTPAPGPATAAAPPNTQAPQPSSPGPAGPVTQGPGGGQASWPQQALRLAQPESGGSEASEPVIPWRPPVDDPFLQAAQAQASVRPASLGRRLAARLIDTLLLGGAVAAAAVPLWTKASDHIDDKIEQAELSGETVTVWLVDGTTAVHLGIVLAVLLLGGVLYEVLPTAKWGRTLGKRLCGITVLGIESHEALGFGAALRRWLLYSVLGVLAVGVVNVLWCLFDRPWRQCWHDKVAGSFVAGTGGSASAG